MKPPVLGPGPEWAPRPPLSPDPLPMLWATGGIFGVVGLFLCLVEHPLVPLSHVFGLLPVGLGGAIGAAILREKYGPKGGVAFFVVMIYLAWQTIASETTVGPFILAAGLFSLTRAIVRVSDWEP